MIQDEGCSIYQSISPLLGKYLDGKESVTEMKNNGSRNWKQMEWMGFYLEELTRDTLSEELGGGVGPKYGMTTLDYKNNCVWDIKTHALYDKNGKYEAVTILNDLEAIESVIRDYGEIGFIMYLVKPVWDLDGSFKIWHDSLKGSMSDYEKERIARGAKSRARKSACSISAILIFKLNKDDLESGVKTGWLGGFQKGMRNADGSPRREKVSVNIDKIPQKCIIVYNKKDSIDSF
jgi:hypothetical protein